MRLPIELQRAWMGKPQMRFGTVTSVADGICTVQVAGGEIPVVTLKGAPVAVGDFVSVQRQSVVSYLMMPPSGSLWVADFAGRIWRVSTSGQFTSFPVPEAPEIFGITYGSDHNLWAAWNFAGGGAGIGRMTPTGTWTSFPLTDPAGAAAAYGLCTGSDGHLWVSDVSGSGPTIYVWRVATDGSYQTLGPLAAGAYVQYLAPGPNGTIWLADNGLAGVWHGPASSDFAAAAEFVSMPGSFPNGLAQGPDGAMWVADANTYDPFPTGKLWRVTPSGVTNAFTVAQSEGTFWVADGPGAYVWASDNGGPDMYRFETSGAYTATLLTASGYQFFPTGTIAGPDGNLWMLATSGESPLPFIGKLTPSGAFTAYEFPAVTPAPNPQQIIVGP